MIDEAKKAYDRQANRAGQPWLAFGFVLTLVGELLALIQSAHRGMPRSDWVSMFVLAAGVASLLISAYLMKKWKKSNPFESYHHGMRG
jgi:hypothetical protein